VEQAWGAAAANSDYQQCLPCGNLILGIISRMGTKQHKTFCAACGKTTNHVTVYQKTDDGGALVATVQCFEHSDVCP